MPSELHEEQNKIAAKWLKKQGFQVVATNIKSTDSREQPDVIGFRSSCSVVIESKVSRSDFLADMNKPERLNGKGLGLYRFYIAPEGMIKPEELPFKWGLLECNGVKITNEIRPQGNMWPSINMQRPDWDKYKNEVDVDAERSVLYTICTQLQKGKPLIK